MSTTDEYLRMKKSRRRREQEREPEAPEDAKVQVRPLVTQGARSPGYPRPQLDPDTLIRRSLRGPLGGGGWTRIA
jgi:hypothetical protein